MRRILELSPEALTQAWADGAPAIWPLGAIEWHGSHLPLGLDTLVAEAFALRLAKRLNGVLLPTLNLPITTLPHVHSLDAPTATVISAWESTLTGLIRSGARTLLLVTGHYAQGHSIELFRCATRLMQAHEGVRIFAATPLEPFGDDDLLDHAARAEAAQLLAIRPELVHLDQITTLEPKDAAILGPDPRPATAEEGETLLRRGEDAWVQWIANADIKDLTNWYQKRESSYAGYVETYYRDSWEQAIRDWWSTRLG